MIDSQSFSDELRRYIGLFMRWAWLFALAIVLAGSVAYFISFKITPVYQATTTMLISEAPSTRSTDYASLLTSERLTQTYSQLITKQPVLEGVIEQLGLSLPVSRLKKMIQVQPVRDTQLIEIKVNDTDPNRAAQIANSLVIEFAQQNQALQTARYTDTKDSLSQQLSELNQRIQDSNQAILDLEDDPENKGEKDRLETILTQDRQTYAYLLQTFEQVRLAEAQATSNVIQAEQAIVPTSPIRPRPIQNTIIAAVLGLAAAIGLTTLIEALDDTIKGPDSIAKNLDIPILGIITKHDSEKTRPITVAYPRSPVSEAFRALRTNIQFAGVDRPIQSLLITSPSPSEGKTTVAINISAVLAQGGKRVVLIDADLRRPKLHKRMGLNNRGGLTGLFVQSQMYLETALQRTETVNLKVLTSGDLPPNPAELLGSEKMNTIIRRIREEADIIVIDSPPIMAVTDAAVMAPKADGVLIVVKPGYTRKDTLKNCIDQLMHVNANILGIVINDVELGHAKYGYNYYYKGYNAYQEYYSDDSGSKTNGNGQRKSERRGLKVLK